MTFDPDDALVAAYDDLDECAACGDPLGYLSAGLLCDGCADEGPPRTVDAPVSPSYL